MLLHSESSPVTPKISPALYTVERNDRKEEGGGVFIAVLKKYLAPVQQSLGIDCEVLWRKLNVQGSKPL